jgi:hypothetical protein
MNPIIPRRTFIGATAVAATQAPELLVAAAVKAPTLLGYPDRQSYQPGDTLRLHTSVGVANFNLVIERVGRVRERVWMKNGVQGSMHPVPKNASSHGCSWPVSTEVRLPEDWRSGYYEAVLSASTGGKSFTAKIPFVLRAAHPRYVRKSWTSDCEGQPSGSALM